MGAVLTCVQLQGGYAQQDFRPEPLQVPQLDGYSQQGGYDSGYWQPQQQGGPGGQGGANALNFVRRELLTLTGAAGDDAPIGTTLGDLERSCCAKGRVVD